MKQRIFRKLPIIIGFLSLILAAVFLSWRLIPATKVSRNLKIPAGQLAGSPNDAPQYLDHALELRLSYPSKIRVGENGILHLDLLPEVVSDMVVNDDMPSIVAELSMFHLVQTPQGEVITSYDSQQPRTFAWDLTSPFSGSRQGSLWVTMQFNNTTNIPIEVPLVEWDIELEVVRLWGMDATTVTWLAMAALLVWGGMMVLGVKLDHQIV